MSAKYSRRSRLAFDRRTAHTGSGASEPGFRPHARRHGHSASHRTGTKIQRHVRIAERCADACRNESTSGVDKLRAAILIGVISDTHGLLRPEALETLRGSEHIIHAGDIGAPEILDQLAAIAPVTAIRGNVDKSAWARNLSETEAVELAGISIYVLHDLAQLDLKPEAAGYRVVISGHSHVPKQETKNGVLYLNPGSAGPRRFKLPVSVARVSINEGKVVAEILVLSE